MEYALRDSKRGCGLCQGDVLILVLMEYALRDSIHCGSIGCDSEVLILVLMEYALRGKFNKSIMKAT